MYTPATASPEIPRFQRCTPPAAKMVRIIEYRSQCQFQFFSARKNMKISLLKKYEDCLQEKYEDCQIFASQKEDGAEHGERYGGEDACD